MNAKQVAQRIKQIPLFKDLEFNSTSEYSQYGIIKKQPKTFKDNNKNEIKLGSFYSLFIAHMYKDKELSEQFFYLILSRKAEKRNFRQHSFYPIEFNKIYASGKTVNQIIDDLNKQLTNYQLI
jgi:hypothetical protein